MAVIKHHKYVAALPSALESDSIYYVRAGAGFDIYVTNSSGTIVAYPLNRSIDVWEFMPLGMKFPIDTHTAGVSVPPTDNPNYRYIKLTASDSYNAGVLTSESVSGSAPLVHATAVISLSGSPMNGQTVRLINTERRFIRAGSSGTVGADTLQGHWHGDGNATSLVANSQSGSVIMITASAAFSFETAVSSADRQVVSSDGANGSVRVANETSPKYIGTDYFMRIS